MFGFELQCRAFQLAGRGFNAFRGFFALGREILDVGSRALRADFFLIAQREGAAEATARAESKCRSRGYRILQTGNYVYGLAVLARRYRSIRSYRYSNA